MTEQVPARSAYPGYGEDAVARAFLRKLFEAGVDSASPGRLVEGFLPEKPRGRCIVVGCGKASGAMAAAVDAAWPDVALSGAVVVPLGARHAISRINVIEAAHPIPDASSEAAALRIAGMVQGLGPDDLVLALISGGGSALMALPAPGITLADKREVNLLLLRSGASIRDMNVVRKHLSAIKGGRLAAMAAPARVVTLIVSDVPGDDPAEIASGPTVSDESTPSEARAILNHYRIAPPAAVRAMLDREVTLGRVRAAASDVRMITSPAKMLKAVAATAEESGVKALILGDAIEGEAREVGIVHAGIARSVRGHGCPAIPPVVLLSGGETTVSIGGGPCGRGGRNTEFLLSLAVSLGGEAGIWALACDTDGIDGTDNAAGAVIGPDTLERATARGCDPRGFLATHDSYSFFDQIGDLIRTGPTHTNVNDFRAVLVN